MTSVYEINCRPRRDCFDEELAGLTTIIDYGAGNLRSVQNTLDELGAAYLVTSEPGLVSAADKLILPGVGHFGQMMTALDRLHLRQPILDRLAAGLPFFGICVGLQALFASSEESPEAHGLGVFPEIVRRFTGPVRVPHMGWNSLQVDDRSRLLAGLPVTPFTYFAHSYYAPVINATAATCTYLQPYSAALEQDNLFAVQFHPEKSGPVGLQIVKNFLEF